MGKLFAAGIAGIFLVVAGSMLLIYRLNVDPRGTPSGRAMQASKPAPPATQDISSALPAQEPLTNPGVESPPLPDVIPGDDPRYPGPVPNEVAPIAGPAPMGLPTDSEEQQAALNAVRKQRFADQMDRLNRRNEQRGGRPAAGAPTGPPPGQPAPRRRGERQPSE